MHIQMRTFSGECSKGCREIARTQKVETMGLLSPLDLKSRGEEAVTRMWKETHVQMAALTGIVIWVKGNSQPEINLLGGSWEEIFTNLRPLFL